MRLLIIEDDMALAVALAVMLRQSGFTTDHAINAGDAQHLLGTNQYGAAILDLGLPDADGMILLSHLRHCGDPLPMIVLTARSAVGARISGLDAGADDYLVKPFDPDELLARLRAVLRRRGAFMGRELSCGNLAFDTQNAQLIVDGNPVALSQREAALLGLMLRRSGQVVTKRLAEDQLFGMSDTLGSNAVEVYVHRLRQKLEAAGTSAEIVTIRGVGYQIGSDHSAQQ